MESLTLNNIGLKGLAIDPLPWTLPPDFITFGSNFRILSGAIENNGGEVLWSTTPVGPAWYPGHVFHVGSTSGDFWIIAGRNKVYGFDGATWTDITSALGYGSVGVNDELLWTSCMLGQIPIINNPQHYPEYWSPVQISQIMQPLVFDAGDTWQSKGFTAKLMRSHRNFLFALDLTEGGIDFPDSFRWSHPADINFLPATWDETDNAFLAGKSALGGDGGVIIDGLSLRNAFCIYSESGIDILDYTGDEFVWKRRELSSTNGLLSKNCIVEVKGAHFILSEGDIIMNDGNKIDSIAHNRIRKDIASRMDTDNYRNSYAIRNNSKKEAWFCIPETGLEFPNIAYIYNWKDNSWAIRDLPEGIVHSASGIQSTALESWDSVVGLWDNQSAKWGSSTVSKLNKTILALNRTTETIYLLDTDIVSDTNFQFTIERTNFPLVDDKQVTTITRIYPHIQGSALVTVEFGSQDYPDAPVRWKPPVIFDPSNDRKVDIRTTGELHAWRFSSLGVSPLAMSGMTVEFTRSGMR